MELVDLTIQLVEKIFFKPLIHTIEKEFLEIHNHRPAVAQAAINAEGDDEDKRGGCEIFQDGASSREDLVLVLAMRRWQSIDGISCPDKV